MTNIKFGTDGWRGFIADDFTFDNVRKVAGAIASYVLKYEDCARGVLVGYDTRYASDRAAQHTTHRSGGLVACLGTLLDAFDQPLRICCQRCVEKHDDNWPKRDA